MSERSGKERLACIVPSGWLGIGHRLYHRAPGSFDLFRDVPTLTAIPEPTAAFPTQDSASILNHFAGLSDPRREQGRIHRLDEIVFMATCAVFCGADTWEQIAGYAHSKIDWLRTFLTLPGGVPSHDTFRRVFCLLDPVAFQKCFYAWMTALMERRGLTPLAANPAELTPIAIDGKAQRGSAWRTVGQSALHIVSAWAVENHLTLGQVATDAKSNEITAIPELLELLDLEGAVVTIDAMGCHRDSASDLGITRFHTLATPNAAKNQGKTALCSIETELFDGLYGHLRNPCFNIYVFSSFTDRRAKKVKFSRPSIRPEQRKLGPNEACVEVAPQRGGIPRATLPQGFRK